MTSQAVSQPTPAALQAALSRWEGRWRWTRFVWWLPRSLTPGLLVGLVVAFISRWRPWLLPAQIALLTVGLLAAGALVLLLAVWLWRSSPSRSAQRFDALFGLDARLATALELLEGRITAHPSVAAMQLQDAQAHAERVRPSDGLPFAVNRQAWLTVLIAALGLLGLLLIPNPQARAVQQSAAQQTAIAQAASDLRETISAAATDPTLTEEQREELLQALETTLAALNQPEVSAEEAYAALAAAQSALADQASTLERAAAAQRQAAQQAQDRLLAALPQAQSETAGDQSDLIPYINYAAQGMEGLSASEQQNLANGLSGAADALSETAPQTAEQLRQAAENLRQGDPQAAQAALEQAAQSAQQSAQNAQDQQASADQLNQAAQETGANAQEVDSAHRPQLEAGGQQDASSASENPNGANNEGQAQGGTQGDGANPNGAGAAGDGQPSSGGQSDGQPTSGGNNLTQQGGQASAASVSGGGMGAGDGTGGAGTDQAAGAAGAGETAQNNAPDGTGVQTYEPVYDPRRLGGPPTGEEITLESDEGDVPTIEGEFAENADGQASVPYDQVYADYSNAASQALQNSYIPLGLRDVVRDYFAALEPPQP